MVTNLLNMFICDKFFFFVEHINKIEQDALIIFKMLLPFAIIKML